MEEPEEPFALYLPDEGPDTRVLVIYGVNGCHSVLPGRFVGWEDHDDALVIEVEQVDTHTGRLVSRRPRRIPAAEVLAVLEPPDEEDA